MDMMNKKAGSYDSSDMMPDISDIVLEPLFEEITSGGVPVEESPAEQTTVPEKVFHNPYADVFYYEEPDYGINYTPDIKRVKATDSEATLTQMMEFRPDKQFRSYWWMIALGVLLPSPIGGTIGIGLNLFDEKNGKLAGKILIGVNIAKYLLIERGLF